MKLNVGWKWLVVGCLSPRAVAGLGAVLAYFMSGEWPDVASVGTVEYLGDIGVLPALLVWILTFGFAEEIGWRGFAQDKLQKRHNWMVASLVVGVPWALWHLPFFLYKPTYVALGWTGFLGLSISLLMGSVLLGWFYNRTAGSIFVVAIWHATFDLFTSAKGSQGTVAATMSTVVIVWVVCLLVAELWQQRRRRSTGWGLVRTPHAP